MLEKVRRGGNYYFDTYYIYDTEKRHYIGILEDHCRGVKHQYFVGWYFENGFIPDGFQPGETKTFDNEQDALNYIVNGK